MPYQTLSTHFFEYLFGICNWMFFITNYRRNPFKTVTPQNNLCTYYLLLRLKLWTTEFLQVPSGSLLMVVGEVGSGKSSLLSALLGEMHPLAGNAHLAGAIAYAAQARTCVFEFQSFGRKGAETYGFEHTVLLFAGPLDPECELEGEYFAGERKKRRTLPQG